MKGNVPRQNRTILLILGIFVLLLFLVLILLQSSNIWKSFSVESASDTLILFGLSSLNVAAFVVFGFIFLRSIIRLMRERKALTLGAKLKSRLLFYFALVSLLPIIAMAVFSYLFLNRALDRWFSDIPENVVREAREVQSRSNEDHFARLRDTAGMLAVALNGREVGTDELKRIVSSGGLAFAEILDAKGSVIASTNSDPNDAAELKLLREGKFDDGALSDGIGIDAAVAHLADGRTLIIAPDRNSSGTVSKMVDSSLQEFDRLKDQQVTVRQIGFLTLGVLTFLLIFASSWTAFYIARGITVPIKALAEGAEKITHGDLGHRVEVDAEDEFALLVWTFNEMSAKLEANAEELNERRRYIETVLLSLPTGVISTNAEGVVSTINPSARSILRLGDVNPLGLKLLDSLADADRDLFRRLIARAARAGHAADQTRLGADGENGGTGSPVAITASALPDGGGVVLVIEDLSELIAAQRAAAWQEVARRMAHEIKNPLTPIQLSAERMAKKFAERRAKESTVVTAAGRDALPADQSSERLIAEGTGTILREVQSLKAMVDEFSRYARLPETRLEPGDVNDVLRQTVDLYRDRQDELELDIRLANELPEAMLDPEQLKRVFVNLIDNALEAAGGDERRVVTVSTRHERARDIVVVEVADNGSGIDPSDLGKLFQPYFSTKGRGTGLGLAIVSAIVAEHSAKIKAAPNVPRGAKFIVEIPVSIG